MDEDSAELQLLQQRFDNDTHVQAVQRTIQRLDLSPLHQAYRGTGSVPYRPELVLAIILFLILKGIRSPAKWAENAGTKDQCKLLGRGITPSRTSMYMFRDRAAKFIDSIHADMIRQAIDEEFIDPADGCLDGTFVAATASRHQVFRIKRLSRRMAIMKRAIAQLDDPCQVASRKPLKGIPSWLAKSSHGRCQQLQRFRRAKAEMLLQIMENRDRPKSLQRDEERIVISPSDTDAVIGKDKWKVVRPLYNVQYMCDFNSDVILSYDVFRKKNDTGTMLPMIEKTQQITGNRLRRVHADSGYCSLLELEDCLQHSIELFAPVPEKKGSKSRPTLSGKPQLTKERFHWEPESNVMSCPSGQPMRQVCRSKDPRADNRFVIELRFEQSKEHCVGCALSAECLAIGSTRRTVRRLENQGVLDEQARKMDSEAGKASVRRRGIQIERRYGDSKKHRGGRDFHGRSLRRVSAETGLMVVAQNCLTLYNLGNTALKQTT